MSASRSIRTSEEQEEDHGICPVCDKRTATVLWEEDLPPVWMCAPCHDGLLWERENPGVDPRDPRI